jgi:5-methylcytosine-specific restriction protein A
VRTDWTWDELVLACDLVAQNGWSGIRANDARAVELSLLLRRLGIYPDASRSSRFRSANSVQRKTYDIATQRDDYLGRRTRGGQADRRILDAFLEDPDGMHALAAELWSAARAGTFDDLSEVTAEYPQPEGRLLLRLHLQRERSTSLRAEKLTQAFREKGRLSCEVCSFDFESQYGTLALLGSPNSDVDLGF